MNRDYNGFYLNNNSNPLQLSEQTGYIRLLKRKLKERNYFKGEIDDQFDMNVRKAIMKLQNDYGLALTGIVDDQVLEVLLNPSHVSISKEEYTSDDVIILEMKFKKVGPEAVKKITKEEKPIIEEPVLKPKIIDEKKMWEMVLPKEAIDVMYPPFIHQATIYIVRPGDTLWSIAKRFNTTVEEIMIINNLPDTLLNIGQQLIVPRNVVLEQISYLYTVKPGDTLWSIAKRFSTTVDALMAINNLTSINLSIGQQLIVPNIEPGITTYTVKRGNTLWSIAKQFGTTVDQLKRINNLMNDTIYMGQQLIIPR